MQEISIQDAEDVGGGMGWVVKWAAGQAFTFLVEKIGGAVMSGEVDYSGVADSQGTYYNTVGA